MFKRHLGFSLGLALPCACLLAFTPVRSHAATAANYTALRARMHCDRKASFSDVLNNPAAYAGRVLELRGTVSGTAGSDDGVMVILNLPDRSAVAVTVPPRDAALVQDGAAGGLRILVRLGENPTGNVPPLTVLAVAADNEVNALEAMQAAQEAERRQRQKERERSEARTMLSSRPALSSRHAGARTTMPPPPPAVSVPNSDSYVQALGPRARPLFPYYVNFIARQNRNLNAQQAATIAASLLNFADRYNVDPRLVVAMIIAESGFDPTATSRTGAMGLGQLMPGTARALGVSNPYDPVQNLNGSIAYLRNRLDTFRNSALPDGGLSFEQVRLAMAAYNAGTEAVRKYHGVPPYRETQAYVRRIESIYRKLTGQ